MAILIALWHVPESRDLEIHRLDLVGALLAGQVLSTATAQDVRGFFEHCGYHLSGSATVTHAVGASSALFCL